MQEEVIQAVRQVLSKHKRLTKIQRSNVCHILGRQVRTGTIQDALEAVAYRVLVKKQATYYLHYKTAKMWQNRLLQAGLQAIIIPPTL